MGAKGWVVLSLSTGAMDGIYTHEEDAREVFNSFAKTHPSHLWALVQIHASSRVDGGVWIGDEAWHMNRLDCVNHQEAQIKTCPRKPFALLKMDPEDWEEQMQRLREDRTQ